MSYIKGQLNKINWRSMNTSTSFTTTIEEDVVSGELVLSIPQEIISRMGWYEGTEIDWSIEGNEIILRDA